MRRMGMAGIGFSAFSAGLLGNPYRRSLGKPLCRRYDKNKLRLCKDLSFRILKPYSYGRV